MGSHSSSTIPELLRPYVGYLFQEGGPLMSDTQWGQWNLPGSELYRQASGLLDQSRPGADMLAQLGLQGGLQGGQNNMMLAQMMGMPSAGTSAGLNSMVPGFLGASAPFVSQLQNLIGQGGRLDQLMSENQGPFQGQAAQAALAQMANTGPQGDLYNRAVGLMTPQVRASFSSRGLGSSGAAIREEGNQVQQLADSMAQRAMQERIGLLGQAVGGEQANASMTGALSNLLGERMRGLSAGVQGALGGAQLPGQIFGQLQGGIGQGMQNFAQAAGLNLTPMQASMAGTQALGAGLGLPFNLMQLAYQATRAPIAQAMQGFGPSTTSRSGK